MILVITGHYFGHGGLTQATVVLPLNANVAKVLTILSVVAVDCFFLITGYFIRPSEGQIDYNKTINKALQLWLKVFLYGTLIYLLFAGVGLIQFSVKDFVLNLFPWITSRYWFFTVYLEVMLLLPFLSKLFAIVSDKELILLVLLLSMYNAIIPLFGYSGADGHNLMQGLNMVCISYLLKKKEVNARPIAFFVGYIALLAVGTISTMVGSRWGFYGLGYNSPFVIGAAVCLFESIRRLNIKAKFFSAIAPYVFAIYLINDHKLRQVMYDKILHCSDYYCDDFMIVHFLICITSFVVLGIAIDWIMSKVMYRWIRV